MEIEEKDLEKSKEKDENETFEIVYSRPTIQINPDWYRPYEISSWGWASAEELRRIEYLQGR